MKNKTFPISLALSLLLHLILGGLIAIVSEDNKNPIGLSKLPKSETISIAFGPSRWRELSPKSSEDKEQVLDLKGLQIQSPNTQEHIRVQRSRQGTRMIINRSAEAFKRIGLSVDTVQNLKALNFDIQFIAPKDLLQQSEHNSPDKKFYSFFWRSYLTYVSRIISTYQTLQLTKPAIKKALMTEKHFLTAKVVFDKKGDIVSLQMIETSPNEHAQELFEKSLEKIQIPNPPAELLGRNGKFTFHYILKIN